MSHRTIEISASQLETAEQMEKDFKQVSKVCIDKKNTQHMIRQEWGCCVKKLKRGEREIEIPDERQSHWHESTDNIIPVTARVVSLYTFVFSVALP